GLGHFKSVRVATDHISQLAVFRACLATRYWSIEAATASFFCGLIQLASYRCRRGCVVDVNCASFQSGKDTSSSESNGSQIVVIADTGEYEIRALSGRLRRRRGFAGIFGGPPLSFCGRPVEHCNLMASSLGQMTGHWISYHTKTNKCDFSHFELLVLGFSGSSFYASFSLRAQAGVHGRNGASERTYRLNTRKPLAGSVISA